MVSPLWAIVPSFVKQISKHGDLDRVITILMTAHLFSDFFFNCSLVLFFLGSPSFHPHDTLCSFQSPHGAVGVCFVFTLATTVHRYTQQLRVAGGYTQTQVFWLQLLVCLLLQDGCNLKKKNYWLCWVFIAARGLSLVRASGGYSLLVVHGLLISAASSCREQALGTRASVVGAHRLSCPPACGIFLDQGSNPCPLHWQADS